MANEFRMQVSRVSFPLVIDGEDEEGNPKELFNKRYSIDVGNKEKLKAIFASCKDIEEQAKNIGDNDEAFDKLEGLARGVIQSTLGDWDAIWEASGHNIFAMVGLTAELARVIKEDASASFKRYGL